MKRYMICACVLVLATMSANAEDLGYKNAKPVKTIKGRPQVRLERCNRVALARPSVWGGKGRYDVQEIEPILFRDTGDKK